MTTATRCRSLEVMSHQAISQPFVTPSTGTPADVAQKLELARTLPGGDGERFSGYGVIGVPFASGHYLALRRFPASSIGPAYSAVWWRTPDGSWTIISDAPPELGCARYLAGAVERTERRDIHLLWHAPWSLRVAVSGLMDWELELHASARTRLMSWVGRRLPDKAWRSSLLLSAMGRVAGPLLAGGPNVRLRLEGRVPNGQSFQAAPRQVWHVGVSRATIQGTDVGPAGPLPRQAHLAEIWLPQTGIFFAGQVSFGLPRQINV